MKRQATAKTSALPAAKREVKTLLARLPDNCAIEDIQYHLYVLQKIRNGLADAEAGRTLTQDEVEERMAKWTAR